MGGRSLDNTAGTSILLLLAVLAVVSAAPFSKYGRGCADIGCLPSETCVMSQDSCSFGMRDGKDCGVYPTCRKSVAGSTSSVSRPSGVALNPAPDNTQFAIPNNSPGAAGQPQGTLSFGKPAVYVHPTVDPNHIFGQPPSGQQFPHHYPPPPYPGFAPYNPYTQTGGGSSTGGSGGGIGSSYSFKPTPKEPSLIDQFLYNKRGGKGAASSIAHPAPLTMLAIALIGRALLSWTTKC